jgi:peroxiredoxin
LWSPPVAPVWAATDSAGAPRTSAEFSGKPTLLLFYLGASCLHCTEQLQAFRKQQPEFAKLGIDLVGLSTDTVVDLKASLDKFAPESFPFPLLSDQGLAAFKAFRAHDDFENQPLHGTFLVDAKGQLRWWDIGPEPFMDAGFLKNEAVRLLAIPTAPGEAGASSKPAVADSSPTETKVDQSTAAPGS